jgi:probable rRNA maturation factor
MAKEKDANKSQIEILNKTKGKLPCLPFVELKDAVLGKKYELSLVFVGDALSKKLNRIYRGKNKPTNVLSFPLSKNEGEIFINLKKARAEMKDFDEKFAPFVGLLFIHGMLHLKGMSHGSTMEKQEQKLRKKFKI